MRKFVHTTLKTALLTLVCCMLYSMPVFAKNNFYESLDAPEIDDSMLDQITEIESFDSYIWGSRCIELTYKDGTVHYSKFETIPDGWYVGKKKCGRTETEYLMYVRDNDFWNGLAKINGELFISYSSMGIRGYELDENGRITFKYFGKDLKLTEEEPEYMAAYEYTTYDLDYQYYESHPELWTYGNWYDESRLHEKRYIDGVLADGEYTTKIAEDNNFYYVQGYVLDGDARGHLYYKSGVYATGWVTGEDGSHRYYEDGKLTDRVWEDADNSTDTGNGNAGNATVGNNAAETGYTGLAAASDGNWYYYSNGAVQSSYTGLAYDANVGWWYVENGAINFNYNGLIPFADAWWCVAGGQVIFDYTGLWGDPAVGWWYVENGVINFNYSGLVPNESGWWCVAGGRVCFDYTGLWSDPNVGWWQVENGAINFNYNGLIPFADAWWCVAGGQVIFDYTGLWSDPSVGWWYVENGVINFGNSGLVPNESGWWCVAGGQVIFDYTGLWNDPEVGWWYVENGAINFDYTGETTFDGNIYQVAGGKLQ